MVEKLLQVFIFWSLYKVPLQKIRTFYKIVENLHNKVIWVIKFGLK